MLVLVIAIAVLSAHLYTPGGLSFLAEKFMQSLHGPGFGIVALMILKVVRDNRKPGSAYFVAGIMSLATAFLAELVQIPFGRAAQLSDILADAIGIVGFLGVAAIFDDAIKEIVSRRVMGPLTLISLPAVAVTLLPTIWLGCALVWRQEALPQIAGFETILERAYMKGGSEPVKIVSAPVDWPAGSGNVAHLISNGRFGLMLHIYPHPDWSKYSAISFVASSMKMERLPISIGFWEIDRKDGTIQASHYRRVIIDSSPRRHCISLAELSEKPADSRLDKSRVYEVVVGSIDRRPGVEILVDNFRLEGPDSHC